MDMSPIVWRSLPRELLEMIFMWFPLLTIIRFRTISKEFSKRLLEKFFLSSWKQCGLKEFGFLVNLDSKCE